MAEPFPPDGDPNLRDAERMRRVADGDSAALGELMQTHQARVLQTAYRFLGSWDAAEDIVQETFLRVHRAAPAYRPSAAFTTWLYRLVVNLCWDQRRRTARERRLRLSLPGEQVVGESDATEQQERAAQIRNAVMALPDRQRLAVILHRFDGLSHRAIADATGWSVSAIESCLVRAYATLRKVLQGKDV
jgi:RNA polymerase sigma-70 factor (ECF subfamily)